MNCQCHFKEEKVNGSSFQPRYTFAAAFLASMFIADVADGISSPSEMCPMMSVSNENNKKKVEQIPVALQHRERSSISQLLSLTI